MAGQMLTIPVLMLLVGQMAAVDVCDHDECSEMPPGLSLVQLRAKAHEGHAPSECAWKKSTPNAQFAFAKHMLMKGPTLEECEAAALEDCKCNAAISYDWTDKSCYCATGSLETSSREWTDVWTSDCPPATCEVYGDPHIQVFDKPAEPMLLQLNTEYGQPGQVGAFETGDFWLVKSDLLQIQGRYSTVKQRDSSKPFMTGVAIGGSFLQGNKLLIETLYQNGTNYPEGSSAYGSGATWNGKQILTTLPSEFQEGGLIMAKYHNESSVVQDPAKHTRGMDVQLPRGVKLTVNRFPHHIGLAITMTKLAVGEGGQDGQCGNFNGNAMDDTAELIQQRMGHQVAANDLLF